MTPALIHHLVDTTAAIFGITPDHSETIRQWRVNYALLGRILQAKNA